MDSTKNIIDFIRYGYSKEKLYFSFNGEFKNLKNNAILKLFINNQEFEFPILAGLQNMILNEIQVIVFCLHDNIEIEIPQKDIIGKNINFKFSLINNNIIIQKFPLYKDFIIKIEDLNLRNWYI